MVLAFQSSLNSLSLWGTIETNRTARDTRCEARSFASLRRVPCDARGVKMKEIIIFFNVLYSLLIVASFG